AGHRTRNGQDAGWRRREWRQSARTTRNPNPSAWHGRVNPRTYRAWPSRTADETASDTARAAIRRPGGRSWRGRQQATVPRGSDQGGQPLRFLRCRRLAFPCDGVTPAPVAVGFTLFNEPTTNETSDCGVQRSWAEAHVAIGQVLHVLHDAVAVTIRLQKGQQD